jgi:hypothetical protein
LGQAALGFRTEITDVDTRKNDFCSEIEVLKKEIELLKAEINRLRNSLDKLTLPLTILLRRRGFTIYRKEPSGDLLIPDSELIGGYYEMLKKYSFRLFLRDVIKYQPSFNSSRVARYATREVTEQYLAYLHSIGLVSSDDNVYRLVKGPIKSFGSTLEWFVAEFFKRDLSAEAVWGVKAKRPKVGGDYDLLAKIDGSLVYMEIKSSPPKQIYQSEVKAFLERVDDLAPEIAIFFVDTELRMKDKIVPMFEEELKAGFPTSGKPASGAPILKRIEKELFGIAGLGDSEPSIFIMNAKDSVIQNVEKLLGVYFRKRSKG